VAEATEAAEATVVRAVLRGGAGCADGGGQDGAAANGATPTCTSARSRAR
jgi:hypothetical protein